MNELALFAGAGGGILGGKLLGWNTVAAVEIERYPREVLLQRQRDGIISHFPIWDDIRTFNGKPWRGLVDVVSGGFPCQDISSAGKGAGIDGERSGLWTEMCRIIREVRPRFAFMENSPMLTSRGLHRVLGDLAEAGYHAAWCVLGADDVGAPHRRKRIWILAHDTDADGLQRSEQREQYDRPEESACRGENRVESGRILAYSTSERLQESKQQLSELPEQDKKRAPDKPSRKGRIEDTADPHLSGREEQRRKEPDAEEHSTAERRCWWSAEPSVGRVAHGVAHRVDRLKAIGNGQVPLVAAIAFETLRRRLAEHIEIK